MMQLQRTSSTFRWLLAGGVIMTVAATVVIQFPVKWLQDTISRGTQCKILLSEPMGSIWRGSSAIGFSEPAIDGKSCRPALAVTERVRWTTDCSLRRFACTMDIETPFLLKPLQVTFQPSQITVRNDEARLPAEILEAIGAPWTLLHPRADFTIRWSDLVFDLAGNHGNLWASLNGLSSPISQIKPLGSYDLQATFTNHDLSYTLTTSKGPLILNAKGTLGERITGQGDASATPEMQEALTGLLNLIGRRQGNVYQLIF
jgi:general secretion pathway protein N